MKTVKTFLIALIVPVIFTSCQKINGKGDVISETRTIVGYQAIELSTDATVYLAGGDENSIEILAQENILPYIQTVVENGRLVIKEKHGVHFGKHEPIRIYITAPGITSLTISGSGTIEATTNWQGTELHTTISGSGNIHLGYVECSLLKANISGSGSIDAEGGDAGSEDLTISGSGNINLRDVMAGNADTDISGSGDIYTQVNGVLDATISGSGNIYYDGTPQINVHISGSGNIIKL
jgi:hypothetical protein